MEQQLPGNDIEDLTQEQLDETIYKKLTTHNPQAPHNKTQFVYKDRVFKTEDVTDHMVFHYQVEGDILFNESEEWHDLEEQLESKKRKNQ